MNGICRCESRNELHILIEEIRKAPSLIHGKKIFFLVHLSLWKSFKTKTKMVFEEEKILKASQILCQKLVIWRGFCPQKFDGSLAKESCPGGKANCSNDAIQVRLSLLLSF